MRFIDKDNLIKDLKKFRYFLDENDEPTVYASEEVLSAISRYIETYQEDDCIKCGCDYWLKYYDIYTREWLPEEGSELNETIYSFIIIRKPKEEISEIIKEEKISEIIEEEEINEDENNEVKEDLAEEENDNETNI